MHQLPRTFYARDTHQVAKELLGKLLVRTYKGKQFIARIMEVESYVGEDDLACHASKGRTARTEVMYGEAGHAYVYFIYGMYNMLNVVTEEKDFPAAVLIRAAVPAAELGMMNKELGTKSLSGPGKLTRALRIDRSLNAEDLTKSRRLYVADDGFSISKDAIQASPRIGVDYAGEHALLPWRYFIKE